MRDSAIRRKADGTLAESYLIQRLQRPFKFNDGLDALVGAFAFGGGLQNGGLSGEAMSLLKDIFSFDYMGSAEFEWGAVPAALSYIAENANKYQAFSVTFPLSSVAPDWRDAKKKQAVDGNAVVYVIAQEQDVQEYNRRIVQWAMEGHNPEMKEATRLSSTLRPHSEYDGKVQGWLDLNNGVFFFTNKTMFVKTAELFGIDTGVLA